MSTRCNIHFTQDGNVCANIYKHSVGHPEAIMAGFGLFFDWNEGWFADDVRYEDPHYLTARFVEVISAEFHVM